jgi:hypothetical protein
MSFALYVLYFPLLNATSRTKLSEREIARAWAQITVKLWLKI